MTMITESNMRAKAVELNDLYFAGQLYLKNIEFQVSRKMKRSLGNIYYYGNSERTVIKLSHHTILSYEQSVETLTHELIHLEQLQRKVPLGHGPFFQSRCRQINNISSMQLGTKCDHVPEVVMNSMQGRRGATLQDLVTTETAKKLKINVPSKDAVIVIHDVTVPGHAVSIELASDYKKTMTRLRAMLRKTSSDYTNTCMIAVNGTTQNYSNASKAIKSLF